MEKTVMMQHMGRIYVGNPLYEKATMEREEGPEETIDILVEMDEAYEFIPIATLMPDERTGKLGTMSTFSTIKVGKVVSIPDEAIIAELANDSPYYRQYVLLTTGVTVHNPSEMPPTPIGSHKRPH